MTDAPPSRYQVIEKDGRLIVLDRGEPVETLVKHSHDVVTPGDRRRADNAKATRTSLSGARSGPKRVGNKLSLTFPVGPGGSEQSFLFGRAALMRIFWSLTALFFGSLIAFFVFGPFFALIALVLILGVRGRDGQRETYFRKLVRAWLEWAARAAN